MTIQNPYADTVRSNVIWFMVDQMRGQALSLLGDPNVRTPNLDRMAIDGTWFRNACMGFPLCCPARGSMLTSVYPHRCVPGHEYPMPVGMPTVAHAFNAAGYDTAWFGKWHLDGHREGSGRGGWHIVPRERRGGFGTWVGYENNNSQFDCWVHGHDDRGEVDLYRLPGHETGELTNLLLQHVTSRRDRPFFACVSVQPPHNPYSAPADMAGRHNPADIVLRPNVPPIPAVVERARRDLAGYYALIEDIDRHVGRLIEHLEAQGIADRTYIIFTSDHGDQHGCHGHFAKMTPYEEAIRVPFLVHGGRRWSYHRGWGEMPYIPNHVDLAPTSLGLAGIPVPAGMEGHDFSWAVLRKPAPSDRPTEAYLQSVVPTNHGGSNCQTWRGLVTEDGWKYVAIESQPLYLFDLNNDPYELVNLAHESAAGAHRARLNAKLAEWVARTGDHFPLPTFNERGVPSTLLAAREHYPQPAGT